MPSDYKAITKHNEEQLGRDTASRKTQISMYSDSTHFVYEILQNADDYGAKEVFFKLSEKELWIEHDGKPFTKKNVKAITYFGQSTSREDLVKTGRFGVGFKSVFAFTATPIIISGCEHFQIYDLYRVKEYPYPDDLPRSRTRIILSFNHESEKPDYVEHLMPKAEAYSKIEERLTSLNKNTLLFTQNIRQIRWEKNDGSGYYSRQDDKSNNARMTTITDGEHVKKYLVFSRKPRWNNEDHKTVDVAFGIDEKGAIVPVPAEEGFLYVLFATERETHLRFILNGPYRTTPARENISEDDSFNRHLIKETCDLVKDMLLQIRKKGLLTTEFLAVLPNRDDDDRLKGFYEPIMDRLVEAFKNEQLIPMKQGGHAPATDVFRGSAQLSDLIDDKDLAKILSKKCSSPLWIANPSQRNRRARNFLDMLEITEWTTQDLVDKLSEESETIKTWLKDKSDEWHQELYALLGDFLSSRSYIDNLSNLSIVRISDSTTYMKGEDCYFPSDDIEHDKKFPRVAKGVYSSGKDEQQEKAREFLEYIGVSEVEESDRVEAILEQRYVKGTIDLRKQHHEKDLKRFITLIKDIPWQKNLFKDYFIFELDDVDNEHWGKPSIIFLDSPYLDTGLRAYYDALSEDSDRKWALSPKYEKYGIEPEKLGKFAKAVGAQTKLEAEPQEEIPFNHPERFYLMSAPGERKRDVISNDYTIPEFKVLLDKPNLDKARLIWRTMDSLDDEYLKAKYRKNVSGGFRYGASSLIHDLRKEEWVPQKYGETLRFVRPCDASSDHLPEGFPYKPWQEWIHKIEFGKSRQDREEQEQRRQEQATREYKETEKVAKNYGLDSVEQLEKLGRLNKENPEAIQEFLQQQEEKKQKPTFPERTSNNPDRRQEKVKEQLANASEKEYEERPRSVRTSQGEIDRKTYLRNQYTNNSGEMVCQICKDEMPFKQRDGEYYFEAVEALSRAYFHQEHAAQYLALCPICTAKYKEFIKYQETTIAQNNLHDALKDSDDLEVLLKLGEEETSIQFVQTHRIDVKTILNKKSNDGGTP